MKKKVVIVTTLLLIIIVGTIIGGMSLAGKRKVSEVNKLIKSMDNIIPNQKEYDRIVDKYMALNENQKKEIEGAEFIDKYSTVDLNNVIKIKKAIDEINESTEFDKIIEIKDEINDLSQDEKKLIEESKIDEFMELSNEEKAALEGAKNIKSVMKSGNKFKVTKVTVKNDLDKMGFYWVLIKYTGENSFGAEVDGTSCFGINEDFEDPFFPLALLSDVEKYLDSPTSYLQYSDCEKEEIEIEPSKIMYYLKDAE